MAEKSRLETIAEDARKKLIVKNIYNGENPANNYSDTHTRALSDQETPTYGKGNGEYLNTYNFSKTGSDIDINGSSEYAGSGRNAAIAYNQAKWGYGPNNPYNAPNINDLG
jgi:hypothetical protein